MGPGSWPGFRADFTGLTSVCLEAVGWIVTSPDQIGIRPVERGNGLRLATWQGGSVEGVQ